MQRTRWLFIVLLLFVISSAIQGAQPLNYVLILSLDGARPDVVLRADTPNIDQLARKGAFTLWAQTILPSSTLPAHTSMLTGVPPETHGVLWNDYKPEKGFVGVSTVFELAKSFKLKTAMFVGKQKLIHIAKPGTVDKFEWIEGDAKAVAKAAAKYIGQEKPSLCFVHFSDPDGAGHSYGWGSKEHIKAIENCDGALGILLKGLKSGKILGQTLIIITADHGGHEKTHGSSDVRDTTIPWICAGPLVKSGMEIQSKVSTCDTAATAAYALGLKIPESWLGKPILEIFTEKIEVRACLRGTGNEMQTYNVIRIGGFFDGKI